MVFFALTHSGYESYASLKAVDAPLWVTAEVLSTQELSALRATGANISTFNYSLALDDEAGVQEALDTIREHHPGHTIWVGY